MVEEFFDFWVDNQTTVKLVGIIFVEILMVVFGWIKIGEGNNFGDDGLFVSVGLLKVGNGGLGGLLLKVAVIGDRGAVLGTKIRPLAIKGGGIVEGKKNL